MQQQSLNETPLDTTEKAKEKNKTESFEPTEREAARLPWTWIWFLIASEKQKEKKKRVGTKGAGKISGRWRRHKADAGSNMRDEQMTDEETGVRTWENVESQRGDADNAQLFTLILWYVTHVHTHIYNACYP